ncbi:hypothetical protein CCHL11_00837 [Colletotrichum chlorophyti]|uniref:Uncharacterized protein n=1 Tax=Colletotrichum chlorophyti TaxID=708187 RepID=A0A1Q8S574_9PEZI|nr:hypothetical protein CCHL11_00837 [Colletotrichum chlorophyti]
MAATATTTSTSTNTYQSIVVTSFPHNPLTTQFQPPASCSAFYYGDIYMVDPQDDCLPTSHNKQETAYYSPGYVCPKGYMTAKIDNKGVHSITTVTCCPYRSDIILSAVDPATLSGQWANLYCTWIAPEITRIDIVHTENDRLWTEQAAITSPGGVNAYGIRMVYQSSDLETETAAVSASASATDSSTFNGASTAFYSPGNICPTGYTAQPYCSRNGGVRTVTTVTCCPYRGDMTLSCVEDDLTLAGPWETQFCTWMAGPATVVDITRTYSGSVITQAVTMSDRAGVNAWGIRMVYQESDINPKTTSVVSSTATGATAVTGETGSATQAGTVVGATNTSAATSIQTTVAASSPGAGLSTAATVAVAVVVPVIVIAALVGLFLLWRRRKHRYAGVQPTEVVMPPQLPDGTAPAADAGSAYAYNQNVRYTGPPVPQEMGAADMGGYYQNDKVLMNPNLAHHPGYTQFKGYPHAQPPAELSVDGAPLELPADNNHRR